MAAPQCMSNDGNPAVFIGTFLHSGDSVALCNDCMPQWASAVVSGMLGIDHELFAVAVAAMEQDAEKAAANDPADTAAPPAEKGIEDPGWAAQRVLDSEAADTETSPQSESDASSGPGSQGSSAQPTGTENPAESPPDLVASNHDRPGR